MYIIKYHPLVEKDLKQLNNSIRIEVFKRYKVIYLYYKSLSFIKLSDTL